MKKTLIAVAVAAAAFTVVPAAFAQNQAPTAQQGWYISADSGYATVNKGPYDDGEYSGGVKGGYRFAINPETSLGVEVGYQYLGRVSTKSMYTDEIAGDIKSKLRGTTAGLDLRYNFAPAWYGELRAGLFYAQGEGLTNSPAPVFRQFNRTKYYAGVGAGYNINPHWSVGLNYDYYGASGRGVTLDTNKYSVNAEYRF